MMILKNFSLKRNNFTKLIEVKVAKVFYTNKIQKLKLDKFLDKDNFIKSHRDFSRNNLKKALYYHNALLKINAKNFSNKGLIDKINKSTSENTFDKYLENTVDNSDQNSKNINVLGNTSDDSKFNSNITANNENPGNNSENLQSNPNTNDPQKFNSYLNNLPNSNTPTELSPENLLSNYKVEQMNKILPLGKNIVDDAIRYKIFQDSTPSAVEELKKDVPEIDGHIQFREWINSIIDQEKQEEVFRSQGILVLKKRHDLFHKLNVDMHNYRKFHDREYEVDIEEVLTKDLFEKQRVVDTFVEENKDHINNLIGYYNNRFKHLKYNKFNYLIYQNNYLNKMNRIKMKFLTNIAAVGLLSGFIYLVNPFLMVLLIPEYFAILFYSYLLNNLVDQIVLCENKQNVVIRTFNFLGFRKEFKPKIDHQIIQMSYYEKFYNTILNISDKGWFYTTRLLRRIFGNKNKKNLKNEEKFKSSNKENISSLDDFKIFHVIRSNNRFYYIPADLSKQHVDTNEELILNILNRNQKFVEEYDYSTYDDRVSKLKDAIDEYKKEYAKKSHEMYVTEKEKLKAEYSNIIGNRDFSDNHYELTLKRSDGIDGTYINNGYR